VQYIRALSSASKLSVVPLDLSSVRSVQDAAPLIAAAAAGFGKPLRGLILNAGVWPGQLQKTEDGMELALQANHIGHWQLTKLLLPEMQNGGNEVRIVTTSSSAHASVLEAGSADPLWNRRSFDTNVNYGRSKFANMLFAQELAERAPAGVRSLVVHPGLVLTTLFKELGPSYAGGGFTGRSAVEDRLAGIPALRELQSSTPLKLVLKSPTEGCRPLLYALLAPGLANGAYIADCEVRDISPASKSVVKRKELWEWTRSWVEQRVAEISEQMTETSVTTCEEDDECGLPSD